VSQSNLGFGACANRVLLGSAAAAMLVVSAFSHAAGDASAGADKIATCAACHGDTGVSEAPSNPILAGQYESYLVQALQAYQSGARQNAIMQGMAATLTDQDIADIAAYFASQSSDLRTAGRP